MKGFGKFSSAGRGNPAGGGGLRFLSGIQMPGSRIRLLLLALLAAAALIEFIALGLARRTFMFYALNDRVVTVEDRMLRISGRNPAYSSGELDIIRYVEEALLGPVSPDSLPLFPKETKLQSLLYRDGVVYADLSEEAALPPLEGGEVYKNFRTLYSGIRRNFPSVSDVRFFIAGKAAYVDGFGKCGFSGP